VSITEAIGMATKNTTKRPDQSETPIETADRLRGKYGVSLSETASRPLPKSVFDTMWATTADEGSSDPAR
jgi:antitoxin VapB